MTSASFQDKVKIKWTLLKQWIKTHPQTVFMCGLILFLAFSMLLIGAEIIRTDAGVLNGKIANLLTFDPVAGLAILLTGGFTIMFGWFISHFFLGFIDEFKDKEEKKRLHTQTAKEVKE